MIGSAPVSVLFGSVNTHNKLFFSSFLIGMVRIFNRTILGSYHPNCAHPQALVHLNYY